MKNSEIIIARNIKLDKEYKNVLSYNESSMLSLVRTNAVASASNYSFIKPGKNQIDVSFSYSDCLKANYVAFQNPYYSNKWFFAFIDDVEFRNINTTRISFTVDVFSTWFDYWQVEPTFVVREHVNDDRVGLHTIREDLETGDYIVNDWVENSILNDTTCIVASTIDPYDFASFYGGNYNGIPSGPIYLRFDEITPPLNPTAEDNSLSTWLESLTGDRIESVKCMFLAPKVLAPLITGSKHVIKNSDAVYEYTFTPHNITNLDGYVPKNNKVLTFPFCYTLLTNNQGSNAILKQELWEKDNNDNRKLNVFACLTPGCSIRCFPVDYNGKHYNYEEGINLGKYPQLNWTSDQYTNWLTNNGVNIATNLLTSAGLTVSGLATQNSVAISSGVVNITNTLNEVYNHSLQPPQTHGNLNSGDVTTASNYNNFTAINMSIKREYAKIIDDYFMMRGYKVNTVKVPNQTGRAYYNYVQIANDADIGYPNSNLYGIPAPDMEEINNIYRRGVTIWHNHANLGDYSLDNRIVS